MKRDDTVYLQHILDAIAKVRIYLLAVDEASFFTDSLVQDGVIRQIEIIGEATKRLSGEVRARYAHVPWMTLPECGINSFTTTSVWTSTRCGSQP